jgi:hypothetical protein
MTTATPTRSRRDSPQSAEKRRARQEEEMSLVTTDSAVTAQTEQTITAQATADAPYEVNEEVVFLGSTARRRVGIG